MIIIAQHTVRDYDTWKPVFDEHEGERRRYGCLGHTIYRDLNDPNKVTILMTWESRERAEAFRREPSLAEAMKKGGIIAEPKFTLLEQAEASSYAERNAA